MVGLQCATCRILRIWGVGQHVRSIGLHSRYHNDHSTGPALVVDISRAVDSLPCSFRRRVIQKLYLTGRDILALLIMIVSFPVCSKFCELHSPYLGILNSLRFRVDAL